MKAPRSSGAPGSIVVADLRRVVAEADLLPWLPFRAGIEIHTLYDSGDPQGPSSALLRYAPGASVPRHTHVGYEHIYVLAGSQEDERGQYATGAFVINLPGSAHAVRSPGGCLVLAVWEKPVRFDA